MLHIALAFACNPTTTPLHSSGLTTPFSLATETTAASLCRRQSAFVTALPCLTGRRTTTTTTTTFRSFSTFLNTESFPTDGDARASRHPRWKCTPSATSNSGSQRLPPKAQPGEHPLNIGPIRLQIPSRVFMLLVPCIWASFIIVVKLLYVLPRTMPPPIFNVSRLLVSCLCFTAPLRKEFRHVLRNRRHLHALRPGVEVGLLIFCSNLLQIVGLRYTPASRAAFLNQLSTIFIPLSAAALGHEKLTANVVMGALSALFGIALLTVPGAMPPLTSHTTSYLASGALLGDVLELLSAVFASAYVVRMSYHTKRMRSSRIVPLAAVKVVTQTSLSTIWLSSTLLFRFLRTAVSPSMKQRVPTAKGLLYGISAFVASLSPWVVFYNIVLVLWAGLLVSAGTSWLQSKAQAGVSAGETAVLFALQPLWASLFAVVLLKERLTMTGMIGATAVVIGAVVASVGKGEEKTT